MKRILLIGTQGQLGEALHPVLASMGQVTGVSRQQLDLTQPEAIQQMMAQVQPDIVVNAAAYTAVDKAESEPEVAEAVNGKAPEMLAALTANSGAMFVQVSTDYVFNGTQNRPYLETDETAPLGVYGQSKRLGEQAIEKVGDRFLIVRTAWVYGAGKTPNFVKTMLRLGKEREQIRVVMDQVGSPTWTVDLASAIATLISQEQTGIYHYTNSGVASWYDFAVAIFEEAELLGVPLKVQQVLPITSAEYPTPAKRPAYSVLSTAKITPLLGSSPPHWRQSLRKMLPQLLCQL